MLPEERRLQLDGIVSKMVSNNETDDDIDFVVNDFKAKYAEADTPTPQTPKMPILTNESGGFGTALKDVAVGAGKSAIQGAIGTAQMFQGLGQRTIAAATPLSLEQVRKSTGFKSLNESTLEGAGVSETLRAKSRGEQVGKVLGTAGEIATGFVAAKGPQAFSKIKTALNARGEAKNLEKTFESITPKTKDLTPTEYKDLLREGKITPKTASQPSKYILSQEEKITAAKYKNLIDKDPVKTGINIIDDISKKDAEVGEFLRKNNAIFNNGELKNHILNKLSDVTDVTIPESRINKLKQTMTDGFIKALQKNDMESLWQARKAFDRSIEKVFNGSPTLQNQVKRGFRNAIQEFIMERTPEGVYKGKMGEMTELFDMFDTVAVKAAKEKGKSAIMTWVKNNPAKAKAIGLTLGTGAVGVAGKAILGN